MCAVKNICSFSKPCKIFLQTKKFVYSPAYAWMYPFISSVLNMLIWILIVQDIILNILFCLFVSLGNRYMQKCSICKNIYTKNLIQYHIVWYNFLQYNIIQYCFKKYNSDLSYSTLSIFFATSKFDKMQCHLVLINESHYIDRNYLLWLILLSLFKIHQIHFQNKYSLTDLQFTMV